MIELGIKTPPADTASAVTSKYTEAYNLNVRICINAQMAQQNLYEMCKGLKEMRDSKLYKELGYSTFEDYCEQETGFKRSQVYKYIAIVEKLPSEFVSPGRQIGVKKLYLLSSLSEDERTEIAEKNDLESTSVRELEQQVKQLRADKDKAVADKSAAEAKASASTQRAESLSQQITSLEAEIKELESRPIEVAVPDASHEVENMRDAMRRLNREHDEWSARIQDEHFKDVQRIHKEYREKMDQLRAEYEEKLADSQQGDAPEPGGKEIFKAYLANAIDAAKRLTGFLTAHPDDTCRAQAVRFFEAAMKEVQA